MTLKESFCYAYNTLPKFQIEKILALEVATFR